MDSNLAVLKPISIIHQLSRFYVVESVVNKIANCQIQLHANISAYKSLQHVNLISSFGQCILQ